MSQKEPASRAPRIRLSQAERRHSIAVAAAKIFAERGFHATGSRDLARACGISEALMFRHFPSKDELWFAALEACRQSAVADSLRSVGSQPPSTSALVAVTTDLADSFVRNQSGERKENSDTMRRMLLRSMAEDGRFARMVLSDLGARLNGYITDCLRVAAEVGDLEPSGEGAGDVGAKLYRLLFFAVGAQALPDEPAMDMGPSEDALVRDIVRFQLRGLGVRNAAIDRELDQ
ncbi:transcriptional regulator, TetR family [Hyphomonas neptunium ATCC 15444]|uniref:Transcriptional regulator, TetR family n=2 Tax=Hyphomonas TaxID=85 RepID=Q0C038_HYPNA|nr:MULTISPECIES: helix-turn-helix domain-containing protein [Hyphomonas]ABI78714.1 transcriptional regulator, TetR family [Hyphomonas neptunium ATCC 15444]KCZ90512.1 TetR family transcriptional regulator [Hyphomonas hirschiana VP5]